jgi:hypothetical protein
MRRILFSATIFLTIIFCSTGCRKDITVPDPNFKLLFGSWEWIESSGGYVVHTINPGTEGYTMTVEYEENGTYRSFKNGKKESKTRFEFEEGRSIYSGAVEYLIRYKTGTFNNKAAGVNSFRISGQDSLFLRDECYDCYEHIYIRKK